VFGIFMREWRPGDLYYVAPCTQKPLSLSAWALFTELQHDLCVFCTLFAVPQDTWFKTRCAAGRPHPARVATTAPPPPARRGGQCGPQPRDRRAPPTPSRVSRRSPARRTVLSARRATCACADAARWPPRALAAAAAQPPPATGVRSLPPLLPLVCMLYAHYCCWRWALEPVSVRPQRPAVSC